MTKITGKENARQRRSLLRGLCAAGLTIPVPGVAQQGDAASLSAPQKNDVLVYSFGNDSGKVIGIDELVVDTKQTFAWAMDPVSGIVRNGSRLNQVVLIRLEETRLTEQTASKSINGLVAYSGVCSHTGCDVTDWNSEFLRFQCPCHESQFDPADGARVVGGPAPWQLAALPLKNIDGKVGVAGVFEGRVGFMQPGLTPFGI